MRTRCPESVCCDRRSVVLLALHQWHTTVLSPTGPRRLSGVACAAWSLTSGQPENGLAKNWLLRHNISGDSDSGALQRSSRRRDIFCRVMGGTFAGRASGGWALPRCVFHLCKRTCSACWHFACNTVLSISLQDVLVGMRAACLPVVATTRR